MQALQLVEWKSDPVLREVAQPEPGAGEVLVRVGGSGACHTDLHVIYELDGEALAWDLPMTLGHENAGWVHALGLGVHGYEVGQPVAVSGSWRCGGCRQCRRGHESLCEHPTTLAGAGIGFDGGMAEYLLVPDARHLVPLPDGLAPVIAAPLTDAALTPYHAIGRSTAKLGPGSTAVVIGIGGLGHLAVQILKATTPAQVLAVDERPEGLALAADCGADVVASSDEAAAIIGDATRGLGADAIFDFVSAASTLSLGLGSVRVDGDITLVGGGSGTVPVSFFGLPRSVTIRTSSWGSRAELAEVFELAARGQIRPVTTTFGLDEAPEAYRQLRAGTIAGRAVVVPHDA